MSKTLISFLALFCLAAYTKAAEFPVKSKAIYQGSFNIKTASAFVIDSESGDVTITEIQGDSIKVIAKNEGSKDAKLVFEELREGQVKIRVELPSSGGGGINGRSINIGSGNIVISGIRSAGRVVINGVDMTGEFGGDGPVHLQIGIPTQLLAHLKVKTTQGDVSLDGLFDGPLKSSRQVDLNSSQGSIFCSNTCALGNVILKTSQGNVEVQVVKGPVNAQSSQGSITATKVNGDLDLKTSQGDVVASDNIGMIRAKSSQGSITVKGQSGGTVWARTSMGDIRLNNPNAADEDAKTDMGSVRGLTDRSKGISCEKGLFGKPKKGPFDF